LLLLQNNYTYKTKVVVMCKINLNILWYIIHIFIRVKEESYNNFVGTSPILVPNFLKGTLLKNCASQVLDCSCKLRPAGSHKRATDGSGLVSWSKIRDGAKRTHGKRGRSGARMRPK